MGLLPVALWQTVEATVDGSAPAANGHKRDAALLQARQFSVVGELGIEIQPVRIMAGKLLPILDEAEHFAGLVRARKVGVGVTQHAALLLLSEEGQDADTGLAAQREVVLVQSRGIAAIGDGMEVEVEGFRLWKQQGSEP